MVGVVSNIVKDMGITHADFFRMLPNAVGDRNCQIRKDGATLIRGKERILISMGPEQERRIAMIRLPHVMVSFSFEAMTAEQVQAFIKRFDRAFQRGGG